MCVMLCVVYARKNNGGIDRRAEPTHNQSNENTTQPSNNDLLAEKTLQASMEGGSKNTATTKSSNESTVHRNVFSSDETLHPSTSIRFDSIRFDLIPRRIILDSTVYDFVIGIAYHRNRVEEGPAAGEVFPPLRRGPNSNVPVWNDIIHPIRRRRKHTVPVFPIAVGHDSVPFPSNLFLFPRPYFSGIRI